MQLRINFHPYGAKVILVTTDLMGTHLAGDGKNLFGMPLTELLNFESMGSNRN